MMKNQKSKAFTLTELLIVVAIMGILSVLVALNYRPGGEQLKLHRATNKLAQDIRRASEMAMSVKECPVGTGCAGQIPSGGYGVYFETDDWPIDEYTEYTAYLYADTSAIAPERYDSGDQIIETISLEQGVKIKMVEDTGLVGNGRKFCINFKPPAPAINLKRWNNGAEQSLTGDLLITLSLRQDPNKIKTIRANKAGLIYVE